MGRSTVKKKHAALLNVQKKKIKNTILCQVHQLSLQHNTKKTKEMVSAVDAKDVTDSSSYFSSKQGTYSTLGLHPYFDMKFCTANANADTTTANMAYHAILQSRITNLHLWSHILVNYHH